MKSIRIKIKDIAKSLGKSITDISKETGLNRNTVTALYHNKVDGIKFHTITQLCEVYDLDIDDIIEFEGQEHDKEESVVLREDRQMSPFYVWMWFMINNRIDPEYFGNNNFGDFRIFIKKDLGTFYSDLGAATDLAEYVAKRYSNPQEMEKLSNVINETSSRIHQIYYEVVDGKLDRMDEVKLEKYNNEILNIFLDYASYTAFLHSFDHGVDRRNIKKIADAYKMTAKDVKYLTSPSRLIFNEEKLLKEIDFVKDFKKKRLKDNEVEEFIAKWVKNSSKAKNFLREYRYYPVQFVGGNALTVEMLTKRLTNIYNHYTYYLKKYKNISQKPKRIMLKEKQILKKLKINQNPLAFYRELATLREERKKYNQIAIFVLDNIIDWLYNLSGIDKRYLKCLSYNEIGLFIKGFIPPDTLKDRYENGIMMYFVGKDYKIAVGEKAMELIKEKNDTVKEYTSTTLFDGTILNQGYERNEFVFEDSSIKKTKGKILLIKEYSNKLKELVKVSSAVVVESRKLNSSLQNLVLQYDIPCNYGSKGIIEAAKEASIIEVRANHGTSRIIY